MRLKIEGQVGRRRLVAVMLESLAAVAVAKLSAAAPRARLGLAMMSRIRADARLIGRCC